MGNLWYDTIPYRLKVERPEETKILQQPTVHVSTEGCVKTEPQSQPEKTLPEKQMLGFHVFLLINLYSPVGPDCITMLRL